MTHPTPRTLPLPLFPAGVVGSMPRPLWVRDLLEPETEARLGPAEHGRQMDAAVAFVIAMQEAVGLDIVTDGEWRRRSYIGIIADVADGFALSQRDGRWWHTVTRPLTSRSPGLAAEEVRFLRAHTQRATKVCLPSPYLLGQRMWDAEASRDAYPTREAFMEALIPFLRQELIAVRDAGATICQFDDPHLCLFVDERVRAQYADPEREVRLCVEMLNAIVEGIEGITIALHLCRRNRGREGWVGEGGYGPILPALRALNVDQYVMEFTIPVAGDLAVLSQIPRDRQVGLGCVDCRAEHIDTAEEISSRVERALEYLNPEQVLLNPDCGFAPGSAADIPLDEAYLKLKHEVDVARQLRDRYEH